MQTEAPDNPTNQGDAPQEALRDAASKFAELRAYAQQYVSAQLDMAKLTARNVMLFAALGALALLAAAVALIVSVVMFFAGLAGAIGAGLGGRMWLGNLIVGFAVLGLFIAGSLVGIKLLQKSWKRATVKKYELAEQQQLNTYGRTSRDRTTAHGSVEV